MTPTISLLENIERTPDFVSIQSIVPTLGCGQCLKFLPQDLFGFWVLPLSARASAEVDSQEEGKPRIHGAPMNSPQSEKKWGSFYASVGPEEVESYGLLVALIKFPPETG